jgi:hypothetical protein
LTRIIEADEIWEILLTMWFGNEHILRVSENRRLREYFDLKGTKLLEGGGICIMRGCVICTLHQMLR